MEHETDEHMTAQQFADYYQPEVFALIKVDERDRAEGVFAWGMEFASGGAHLSIGPNGSFGHFESADSAHQLYSRMADLRLIHVHGCCAESPDTEPDDENRPVASHEATA
jgi:hypothetical protein